MGLTGYDPEDEIMLVHVETGFVNNVRARVREEALPNITVLRARGRTLGLAPADDLRVWGERLRVWGLGFGAWDLGFRVEVEG